jgi:hypothetical protein
VFCIAVLFCKSKHTFLMLGKLLKLLRSFIICTLHLVLLGL